MKQLFFILGISLMLFGCKDNAVLLEGDKIILQDRFGKFVCADRTPYQALNSNRKGIGNWEVLKVQSANGNIIQLSDFENNPVYLRNDTLAWGKSAKAQNFTYKQSEGRVFLQTTSGKYLRSSDSFIHSSDEEGVIIHRLQPKNLVGGYLGNEDILSLLLALFTFLFLILNHIYQWYQLSNRITYGLIFLAHFGVGLFAITQFNFLFYWDEMFHALVAKNLSLDPSVPRLFNPSCVDPEISWAATDVWLHKQPLFLYQMATAIKLFGVNAISARIPSLLMMTLAGMIAYRMGSQIFNRMVGLIASTIFCFSLHKLELLFGVQNTDHNDIAFIFYVTASFWALVEYRVSGKRWALLGIILFAAFAVLTKWLLGFLVYYAWGLLILIDYRSIPKFLGQLRTVLGSFLLSVILVAPWQLYVHWRFPEVASHELSEIGRHFSEVVEGHGGEWNYHLLLSMKHYGMHYYLVALAPFIAYFSAGRKKLFLVLTVSVVTVYVFYSIAATKMISFTYVVVILICLLLAGAIENLHRSVMHFHPKSKHLTNTLLIATLLVLCFQVLNPIELEMKMNPRLSNFHFVHKGITQKKVKRLHHDIDRASVLFNTGWAENIPAMFYNQNLPAYTGLPDFERLLDPPCEERQVLIFDDGELPEKVLNHPRSILIPNY